MQTDAVSQKMVELDLQRQFFALQRRKIQPNLLVELEKERMALLYKQRVDEVIENLKMLEESAEGLSKIVADVILEANAFAEQNDKNRSLMQEAVDKLVDLGRQGIEDTQKRITIAKELQNRFQQL